MESSRIVVDLHTTNLVWHRADNLIRFDNICAVTNIYSQCKQKCRAFFRMNNVSGSPLLCPSSFLRSKKKKRAAGFRWVSRSGWRARKGKWKKGATSSAVKYAVAVFGDPVNFESACPCRSFTHGWWVASTFGHPFTTCNPWLLIEPTDRAIFLVIWLFQMNNALSLLDFSGDAS